MSSKEQSKQDPPEVAEFQKELYSLFDSRTASASKIDRLTKLALKSSRYYKNVVYCLEKFITRCVPEYKLTGLYVLDSICRTSQSVKTKSSSGSFSGVEYVGRFERNIEALFSEFCKVQEDKEKEKVKRVVDLWERSGTFAPTVTENIKKKYFPLLETTKAANGHKTTLSSTPPAQAPASLAQSSDNTKSPSASAGSPSTSSAVTTSHIYTAVTTEEVSVKASPYPESSNGQTDNSLLAGISDPSSALALQTLLATVSQVKAATAGSSMAAGGGFYQAYPSSSFGSSSFPSQAPPSTETLPPVLQQLQGVLSISNQNGAFLPNNNTMVSSSVASPILHTDAQQGGGFIDGNARRMNTGPGLRDPRVDPRVDPRLGYQQNAHESAQPPTAQPPMHVHAQPQSQPPLHTQTPMFGASAAPSNTPGLLGPGFDGLAMAQLASLLNSSANGAMPSHLPLRSAVPHLPFPAPPPSQGPPDAAGQGSLMDNQYHNHISPQNPLRFQKEPYPLHHNDSSGIHSQPTDEMRSGPSLGSPEVTDDPSIGQDQIRVISRTLWVGGTFVPTISEQELEGIFAVKGKIATLMVNHAKFNAFIKMAVRAQAERCKAELDRSTVQGEVMKVGWGCGFGPRDCFDYTVGSSIIPLERLTDTDRRWLSSSVVGGFGPREPIRGGVAILEPNIEPVGPDGREALPRRGKSFGGDIAGVGRGGRGGGGFGETRGRGRGRGQIPMDHQGRGPGAGRGRGVDDHADQRLHPLPSRPQAAAWAGKRGPGVGLEQDTAPFQEQPLPAPALPSTASSPAYQQHSHEEDTRRNKKSRWE
ncbi:hypothetical protein BGZ58_007536 [Dissophora ornata]|nr:hypothetical protein BGZ58_007536 [Dissophora ornata]